MPRQFVCRSSILNNRALVVLTSLALSACAASADSFANGPEVDANEELLVGQWGDDDQSFAAFKGIPFAAAPVADLRWRAPRPHTPRSGKQQANEYAAACMQGQHIVKWYADVAAYFGAGRGETGKPNGISEDCLYLNVWTPDLPDKDEEGALPVMVWFHGGSNKGGWSYEPNYIGAELARKGVVVVTTTYRLGPFGFFSHPALEGSQPDEAIANFGLLYQILALEWVQANIAAFGGDANNVTCFGESSGAGDLGSVFAADVGVCDRWIAQSPGGSFAERSSLAEEQARGEKIAAQMGIESNADSVHRLRSAPPREVLAAADEALPGHYYDVVKDDRSVVNTPLESLNREQRSKIDFLIGTNRDEWYMYIAEDTDWQDVDRWLENAAPSRASVLKAQVENETDPRRALDRLRTARDTLCEVRIVAARVTATGGRAWVYYFTRQRAGPGGEKVGAYHGTEIPYVFGTHDAWLPTEQIDRRLTDAVMDYWVQFAQTGDPNVPGRPEWPLYRAEKPAVLELGEKIQVVPPVDAALCIWLGPE